MSCEFFEIDVREVSLQSSRQIMLHTTCATRFECDSPAFAHAVVNVPGCMMSRVVSTNTKPFKDRVLVWIGFWKVLLLPLYQQWWLARVRC